MTKEVAILANLLEQTTSASDSVTLDAIRKANAMLSARGITWKTFVAGRYPNVEFTPQTTGNGHPTDELDPAAIQAMFDAAESSARGGFKEFLQSIHEWWDEKGFLTEAQFEALKRAANQEK